MYRFHEMHYCFYNAEDNVRMSYMWRLEQTNRFRTEWWESRLLIFEGKVKLKQRKECRYQDCGIYYYSIIERSLELNKFDFSLRTYLSSTQNEQCFPPFSDVAFAVCCFASLIITVYFCHSFVVFTFIIINLIGNISSIKMPKWILHCVV